MVRSHMSADAGRPGRPPALRPVAAIWRPTGECVTVGSLLPGKGGWRREMLNHPPGRRTNQIVRSTAPRSLMSVSAMLQTTPSNCCRSHQWTFDTSPRMYRIPSGVVDSISRALSTSGGARSTPVTRRRGRRDPCSAVPAAGQVKDAHPGQVLVQEQRRCRQPVP
jgi:hypothetical protein